MNVMAARDQIIEPCDLLVLAAPTHALSLSRPQTREDAVSKGADPAHAATGLREWLPTLQESLPAGSTRPAVAVFDTRVVKARHWPGSAAKSLARRLTKSGFPVVDRASFYVDDTAGPVTDGEHARARAWGAHLAGLLEVGHQTTG